MGKVPVAPLLMCASANVKQHSHAKGKNPSRFAPVREMGKYSAKAEFVNKTGIVTATCGPTHTGQQKVVPRRTVGTTDSAASTTAAETTDIAGIAARSGDTQRS